MQVQQQQQQQSQQQQQLRSTPWMLQVPTMGPSPSDPSPATATSTVSSSPASAFGDRSPSSAYADLAPWWSHSQMAQQQHPSLSQQPPALALDMSVLSVASTDPSPVVAHNMTQPQTQTQPQQHQLRMSSGPLTPVSPPMPHQESGQTHNGYDHVHAPVASVPRKRSLTMATEDYVFDSDDINLTFESASPVEIDQDDSLNLINGPLPGSATSSPTKPVGAKPAISNNFVSKLYQMIVDSKSAQYIQWTEHGTSFVVSNIGEFSRAILGSHFKHSNFSSFVRQLNMYGFHKLNRTPRAQRTSPDAHVWEFSHPLFLRARPDLLEQIRRKAPEAETTLATSSVAVGPHGIITGPARRELPGDIHAALDGARQEAAQARQELEVERRRVTALAAVTKQLHDVVSRTYPNMGAFPTELLESISPSLMQARMQQHSPMTPVSADSSFSAGQSTQVAMSEAAFSFNNQLFGASFVQQGSQPPSIPNVPALPVGISMGSNSSLHQDYSMATGRSTHSSPSVDGASTSTGTGLSLGWNWSTSPPSSAGGEASNSLPWANGSLGHSLPESHPHVAKRPRIHSESAPAGPFYGLGIGPGPAPGPANGHKLSRARSDELLGAPSWATGAATVGATQGQLQQMAGLRHIVPSIARCGRSATPAGAGEQQF